MKTDFLTLIAALLLSLVQVMKGQINLVLKGHLFMKFLIVIINETPKWFTEIITFMPCSCGDVVWCFKYSSANNKIDIDGANSDISFN
jgi:hypothetical protein